MVAVAAVLGGVIASIARGTTAAFVLLFTLTAVVEPAIRGWRPSLGRWLVGENVVVWVGGGAVEEIDRGPAVAGLLLGLYVAAAAAAAIAVFRRRDLGPAT